MKQLGNISKYGSILYGKYVTYIYVKAYFSRVPPHTFISHWLSFSLIFFLLLLRVGRHFCLELAGRQKEYGCAQLSECHFHTYKR